MLEKIKIVLVEPSHPGNIGAAARALKTMGLHDMVLVNPEAFPNKEATYRAAGADDILARAKVVETLADALTDCDWVIGASVRLRTLARTLYNPRTCAEAIASQPKRQVAIVFGRESSGLTNDELALCHDQVSIPANDAYSSLNLAAAIQVICYELRMAAIQHDNAAQPVTAKKKDEEVLASSDQVAGFYMHLKNALITIGFMDPKQPKMLMERLQLLFNRTHMTVTELNILRGMLSAIEKYSDR